MGLMSFVKEAGAFLFGHSAGEAQPPSAASQLTVELLQKQAAAVGVAVQNLAIELNDGTATAHDVLELIELLKQRARAERGIELQTEVEIIGDES